MRTLEFETINSHILHHDSCDICVFGENGFYNAICAHCGYCTYSKGKIRFMTRELAERLGVVMKKEVSE